MKYHHQRFIALLAAALVCGGLAWVFLGSPAHRGEVQTPRSDTTAADRVPSAVPQHPAARNPHQNLPAPGRDGAMPARILFGSAWGHEPKPELEAFDDWTRRYLAAAAADRARITPEGMALLRRRMAALKELIKTDPRQVIASTVPAPVRAQLPPDMAAELEQRVAGAGRVALLGALAAPGGTVPEPVFRKAAVNGREYQAYVYGRRVEQATKVDISITGVAIGGALAVSESPLRVLDAGEVPPANEPIIPVCPISGEATPIAATAPQNTATATVVEVAGKIYHLCHLVHVAAFEQQLINAENAAGPYSGALTAGLTAADGQPGTSGVSNRPPLAWSTGTKRVLVIRVDFSDKTGTPTYPYSPFSVIDPTYVTNVFNQTNGIGDYYAQASYGQTALSISTSDVTAVLRMPSTAAYYARGDGTSGYDDTLHTDAEAAATTAGFTLANYDRIGVVFANLGTSSITNSLINYGGLGDIQGTRFWINGFFDFRDCSHEIGHNYGLQHCNLWQVTDGNPVSDSGTSTEYGDPFGVMGSGSTDINYHFDMWEKSILHWIPDTSVTTVTTAGTYRVYRFDHASANTANPLALKIVRNASQDYWIGLRQLFTSNASLMNGAYILWGYNSVVQGNLLDMTTPGTNPQDAALATGATFHDTEAGIILHPLDKGGTTPNEYLDVQVSLDPRIQWQSSTYNVDEQLGPATLTLTRSASSTGAVSVNYATSPGTATAPANYTTQSGTISWADGDSAPKTLSIPITSTAAFTGIKTFTVNLSGISGGVILNSPAATVNIASAGATDPSFTADFVDSTLLQTLVQPDGKVLVAGWLGLMQDSSYVSYTRNGFGRLNAEGTVDAGFGNGSGADVTPVNAMVLQPDGKVLIGGSFAHVHGIARNSVARLNTDGSLDTTFDPGAGPAGTVNALLVQPDGKVLVGGSFTSVGAASREYLARLNADGTLDTGFVGPDFAQTGGWEVDALALQPDGKILVGGTFYFSGGAFSGSKYRSGMIRVTSNGSVDTSFDTGNGAHDSGDTSSLERVRTISLQRDGSAVLGGDFTGFGGVTHNHLVRVTSTGAVDASFTPDADGIVHTTLVQADGKILAGGEFGNLNSVVRSSFGRLNADGTLDTVFGAGTGSSGKVYDFAMQADGRVILCGDYATIQGVGNITVARLFTGLPGLPGSVQLSAPTFAGSEAAALTITATRRGGSYGAVSMNYGTQAGSAAPTRYTPVTGTLSWADGDATSKTFTVPLINDQITQAAQTFLLNLGIPVGGVFPGSPGTAAVTVSDSSATPYAQWQSGKFTAGELLDPSISGDLADPDHDGLPNLLEYAFGFEPKIANAGGSPTAAIQNIGGTNYLTLTFRRSLTATDLIYNPQCGPTIGTWVAATVQVGPPVSNGDGTETVTFRDNVSSTLATRRFMRLQVTRSP